MVPILVLGDLGTQYKLSRTVVLRQSAQQHKPQLATV